MSLKKGAQPEVVVALAVGTEQLVIGKGAMVAVRMQIDWLWP